MQLAGEKPTTIARVQECGKFATVERRQDNGQLRIRGSKCKHRFCKRCASAVSLNVADNLARMISLARRRCSHIVLTLKHNDDGLDANRQRLYKCFKKLRSSKLWKKSVNGGAAFCQMHKSLGDGRWHVHFHLVVEHRYIPQAELAELWLKITGDSNNVYIERVDLVPAIVKEVTRYVSSPIDKTTAQDVNALAEALTTCRGARLCFPFGSWRGHPLHARAPEDPSIEWESLGSLGGILARAYAGHAADQAILEQLFPQNRAARGPPTLWHLD